MSSKKKSDPDFYLQQAAKMCPFQVNIQEKLIYIPEPELETDDLTVAHLRTLGFHIQPTIPFATETRKEVYNPTLLMTKKVVTHARGKFLEGDRFRVLSTECELELTHMSAQKLQLTYTNLPGKPALLVSKEQLKKSLSFGTWIRI